MTKTVILIRRYFSQYTLFFYPVSSFKYLLYNIKQKCIFKGLLLGVLCANFGHLLSPGELFLRVSYLKSERSRNVSQEKFSLVPGDVL